MDNQQVEATATVQNTGQWQKLFFDFSTGLGASFPDQPTYSPSNGDGSFEKIVVIFEGDKITGLTYLFDNIEFIGNTNNDFNNEGDPIVDINDCSSMSANGGI